MSASAHKFNGPKGVGFLYIKKGTPLLPYADGGAQEHGLRAGTENIPAIVGMAVALKNACDSLDTFHEGYEQLRSVFLDTLYDSGIDFILNGETFSVPNIISVSIKDASGETILHRLDLMGIAISTGSACDSVTDELSHVVKAIGLCDEYAYGTIRISFGKDNTIEDAINVAKAIIKVVKG
jgi:cysteine desulfurase